MISVTGCSIVASEVRLPGQGPLEEARNMTRAAVLEAR